MMLMMRRFLMWLVMASCAFIAAFISISFSVAFFCSDSASPSPSSASTSASPHLTLSLGLNTTAFQSELRLIKRESSDESDKAQESDASGSSMQPTRRPVGGCDYTVGRWVKSNRRLLYSGNSCRKWLSGTWACRSMPGRPDFNYEKYRWQPDACDLPVFDRGEILRRMRNKVLAFVGDSIGQQQHQSFMCMLTGGKNDASIKDVSSSYGLVKHRGSKRPAGVAHRFLQSNTTIIYYWSASLCDIQPLNPTHPPSTHYAMHLDRPVKFLQKFIGIMDVLVLNTGHHWNKGKITGNKWEMHVDGNPCKDHRFRSIGYARNFSLAKILAWLDHQIELKRTKAEIYMRSLSPRHFFDGEWDSGGRCDNNRVPVEEKTVGGRYKTDLIAENAVMGTRVRLLNITYISAFRDEAHISKYRPHQRGQDCLHWCLPGVPDVWNELLYANLFFTGNKEPHHKTE